MGDFGDTTITYNSITFSNAGTWPDEPPEYPVPFLTKQVEYLEPLGGGNEGRWCRRESINLKGEITACGDSTIKEKREVILDAFNEDFHTLEIEGLEDIPLIRVMGVTVGPQEGANQVVSYSIDLEAYPEDSFAQKYRVLDPSDNVEISENANATASITHSVGCRGINTAPHGDASNALSNAKTFVEEKINSGCLRGNLIQSKDPNWGKYLVNVNEDINRINGYYSLSKSYTSDLTRKQGGEIVVRHTKSIQESWGNNTRIVHSGKIDGGRLGSLDEVRKAYKALRLTFDDPPVKEPFLISEEINEDDQNNSLSFTITLEKGRPEVIDDYSISVSEDSGGSLVKISIQGTISATGPLACRLKKVRKYFCGAEDCVPSAININGRYALFCADYYAVYLQENQINNLPANVIFCDDALAVSVTEDRGAATIQYSMQFDNRITHGHHRATHTMNFKPSIQHIVSKELNRPTFCVNQNCGGNDEGGLNSFDLLWMGFRDRAEFGIQGQIEVYDANGGVSMEALANSKFRTYCNVTEDDLLSQKSESLDKDLNASYDYKWGFHATNSMANTSQQTAQINQLKI